MATNNAINNTLPSPFTLGATSVTSTGTQLNYLSGLTAVPINKVNIQVKTVGTSTYTPTSGMVYCIVEICGGGGGTGGCTGSAGQLGVSAGAGGGGYSRKLYTAALLGASATVVAGAGGAGGSSGATTGNAGGNSTFTPAGAGAVLTANGGAAGTAGVTSATTAVSGNGSTGGSASGGDVNIVGGRGSKGVVVAGGTQIGLPGCGGSSHFAGASFNDSLSDNSTSIGMYGSGAAGTASGGGANVQGAIGADGICIITEFISS
jgi:hypothetical protein